MLKDSTLIELQSVTDTATMLQVARFDAVICTKSFKARHLQISGSFLTEVITSLAHHGVTRRTDAIHTACCDFETAQTTHGLGGFELKPLADLIKDQLAELDQVINHA